MPLVKSLNDNKYDPRHQLVWYVLLTELFGHNLNLIFNYRNIKSLSIILINFLASNTYYYLFLHLDIYSHIKKKLLPSNYIPTHTRIHKYAMAEKSGGAHI